MNGVLDYVSTNPGLTLGVLTAIIVVLLVVVIWMSMSGDKESESYSNHKTGGNMPLAWHGSLDAGNYGPMHREAVKGHGYPRATVPSMHENGFATVAFSAAESDRIAEWKRKGGDSCGKALELSRASIKEDEGLPMQETGLTSDEFKAMDHMNLFPADDIKGTYLEPHITAGTV